MTARRALSILLVSLCGVLSAALPAQAATYPAGFEERTLISGLTIPTAVAWTPDGRAIVVEKSGLVKIAAAGASTTTTVLDLRNRVNDYNDRGLLGLAVDSQFATNPYVYLLYTYELNPIAPDGGGEMVSQLLRVRLTGDNRMIEERVLLGSYTAGVCPAARNDLDCIPSDYDSHSIGTVLSAPDGTLYVGSGDGASYNAPDVRALRSLDERSLAGKILKVDREGRALAGHPLCATNPDLTAVCAKVYASGFRNPFRFTLRPDGGLVVGDVGWNTNEEINLVTQPGRSYGWPCYEGTIQTPGYRDFAQCATEYARPAGTHTPPTLQYCHCGSGASVIGGPAYRGDQYPAGYRDTIFYADYSQGWIKRIELNSSGGVSATRDFATGWSGAQLTTTPSGDVAFPSFGTFAPGTGSVRAIRYVAGNRAPVARATTSASSGSAPLSVTLDARTSTDADGDALTYRWSFGDGTTESTQANPTHTYTQPGTYIASVTVTDSRGASDQASVTITAGNDAPVATILAPADRATFQAGGALGLSGGGTDNQDGTLPGTSLKWRIVLYHGDHAHPQTELTGATPAFSAREDHDADSYYEVTLTVTDSGGLTGTRTIRVDPATVGLTLDSQPAGATITWAGLDRTAPYTSTTAIGFRTEVAAAPTLTSGGRTLAFARWSDGVTTRTRAVTVPTSALSFTAVYEEPTLQPVLALPFDTNDGTVARDASGRGNDGTVRGAAWTASGRYGGALRFDGVDDWVTVTDRAALDLGASYTLSAWLSPESTNRWQTVLMKEAPPNAFGYALYATSDTPAPSAWADLTSVYGPGALPRSAWSHVTVTVGGGVQRLYVDGTQVASAPAPPASATNDPLRIGGNALWSSEFFRGLIDEVRVYDRTLTADQVRADRDEGIGGGAPQPPPPPPSDPVLELGFDETSGTVARDASGKGNDGAVRGATWTAGRYGNGLSFDGVDDWVTVADDADLDLTSPYTLEAWVLPRSRARWQTIMLKELPGTLSYGLYATSNTDVPSAWNGDDSVYGTSALPTGAWRHVAVSVSGGQQRLYVDGQLAASAPGGFAVEGSGPLRIGGNSIWSEFFTGTIDEVRVYPRALTAAEIVADRTDPITDGAAPATGPVASYAFDDGAGTTARDATGRGHTGTVSGATWLAQGRNGGALSFDGTNDWVTVADAPELDLTGRWTLSASVRPQSTAPWQTLIIKEAAPTLAYGLYARSNSEVPSAWTSFSSVYGTASLPSGTWSHVSATFEDGTMRLYVDGELRATTTGAVDAPASNGPLRIGGNAIWGEWFGGSIDDVRIYDRPLSAAEVQADAAAAVTATATAARAASTRSGAPVARAAAAPSVRRRNLTRAGKAALTRRARRAAVRQRAGQRRVLTRRQKTEAIRRSLARLAAKRAAARRRAGRAPVQTRRQKASARKNSWRTSAARKNAPRKTRR